MLSAPVSGSLRLMKVVDASVFATTMQFVIEHWAQGYAAKTEGTAWSVVENKLYLNYNSKVKSTWDEDQKAFIKKADEEYQKASTKKGN